MQIGKNALAKTEPFRGRPRRYIAPLDTVRSTQSSPVDKAVRGAAFAPFEDYSHRTVRLAV